MTSLKQWHGQVQEVPQDRGGGQALERSKGGDQDPRLQMGEPSPPACQPGKKFSLEQSAKLFFFPLENRSPGLSYFFGQFFFPPAIIIGAAKYSFSPFT